MEGKIYQFKLVVWVVYKNFICTEILINIIVVGFFLSKTKPPLPLQVFVVLINDYINLIIYVYGNV